MNKLKISLGIKKQFLRLPLYDERGDTNIVAIILIIVIVIGLVIIFRDRIEQIISSVFDNIDSKVDGIK